ncbi:Na+/H+ antiporter NhaC [Tuberibacillus sp. Marseille-P3662]|uniref:Na+/H+ antiporter NhaC n=1 Tax=Tuberibacillus sp. Marseille-P3662 TaxID=1965358 RepID=UPI000A1C92FD|nr:Na+/H+ antiporter NhaC [Tuberibacillus sp. Marseille-P3662]
MKPKEPKFIEVFLVLFIFLAMMSVSVAVFDIPFQIPLFASWFIMIGLGLKLKHTYKSLQDSIITGISKGLEATMILFTVGALIGTWIAGGIVPALIYYGLAIINPNVFLVVAMILLAITALSTGTSFGAVGTSGIAMMGVGESFGIPLPLVAGAVISGAYVGDKLSPLSDTTVMTASLTEVPVIKHVKGMLPVSLPSLLITGILFTLVGFFYVGDQIDMSRANAASEALISTFSIHWYVLIPLVIVIGLLAMNKPAIPVIAFGALLGIIWAAIFQGVDVVSAITTSYSGFEINSDSEFLNELLNTGGIESMLGVIALILLALGFGGLLDKLGILQALSNLFDGWVKESTGKLTFSTMATAFFGNLFGSAAYVGVITGSKTTEKLYDDRNIDHRVLSRNSEGGGTVTVPMIPWSDAGVFMATTLGISTISYLPFLWYNFVGIIVTFLYGYMGWYFWKNKEQTEEDAEKESEVFKAE